MDRGQKTSNGISSFEIAFRIEADVSRHFLRLGVGGQ
jgi:hypothetical protein